MSAQRPEAMAKYQIASFDRVLSQSGLFEDEADL
jgi:hypothetical protein